MTLDEMCQKIGYKSYDAYLDSPHWIATRKRFRQNKCYCCLTSRKLQLHHITYENLGKEKKEDLVTVCSNCHYKIHSYVGVAFCRRHKVLRKDLHVYAQYKKQGRSNSKHTGAVLNVIDKILIANKIPKYFKRAPDLQEHLREFLEKQSFFRNTSEVAGTTMVWMFGKVPYWNTNLLSNLIRENELEQIVNNPVVEHGSEIPQPKIKKPEPYVPPIPPPPAILKHGLSSFIKKDKNVVPATTNSSETTPPSPP